MGREVIRGPYADRGARLVVDQADAAKSRVGSHSYSWMAEPPAAAIFSFADALNACAEI
jgi:hypothetical protein